MSTKTTIKRIALVAVAALTVGSVSAVSAKADGFASTTFASITGTKTTTFYSGNFGFTNTFTLTGTAVNDSDESATLSLATGTATSCTATLTAATGWSMTGNGGNLSSSKTITRSHSGSSALSTTVVVECASPLSGDSTVTVTSAANGSITTATSATWTLDDLATATSNNTKLVAWSGVGLTNGEPTLGGSFNHKTVNGVSGVYNTVRIKSNWFDSNGLRSGNAVARQITLTGGTIKNIYSSADEFTPLTGVLLGQNGITLSSNMVRIDALWSNDYVIEINTPATATMLASLFTEYSPGIWNALATESVNIVVDSALASSVYSYSTVTRTPASAADLGTPAAVGNTAGTVSVVQKDAAGNSLLTPFTKAVTATITGVGTFGSAAYVAVPAGSANGQTFTVYSDGRAGTASVAIAVNGVVVSTKTFTFYGSLAKYSVSVDKNYALAATAGVRVATVTPVDALGNVVANASAPVVTSSDALIARNPQATLDAVAADGTYAVTVDTVNRGAFTLTIGNAPVTPTITATVASRVTGVVDYAKGVSWTLDEASYEVGSKITLTFTLKDSDGNPGADATHPLFSVAPTANLALAGYSVPAGITTKDGKATFTFFAPGTPGDLVLSGKLADTATTAVSLSAKIVNSSIDAAADSASEATEAANAATDAANAAAEAADAATAAAQDAQAAVADLAAQVATLIAGIKAQITRLTNLVVKIQKKVKA